MDKEDKSIEAIQSELEDTDSVPIHFEVLTYPADFTLENLVSKYQKNQIKIPGFQRKYVWDIKQASKLIESFLLGLPVPSIFLYNDLDDNNVLNVIDGQQRLMSVLYYFNGYFGDEEKGKKTVFKLKGINSKSPYFDKSYDDLKKNDLASFNRLNDSVLRAFVIKQINPQDNTSIYHIFERLNTGGVKLEGQEIRNCVYHGNFNELLNELNKTPIWRELFGQKKFNQRLRDVELILRFFALSDRLNKYEYPMKDFLSNYMKDNQNVKEDSLNKYKISFNNVSNLILSNLGKKPFHIKSGLNAAVFDSVFVAFAKNPNSIPEDIKNRYADLKNNEEYMKYISSGTTNVDTIKKRVQIAERILFK
ncbi:DUF262 domain-containing protein [Leptospira idonii]|uniref:DUF262 domain-containing protein n=1 Tax=Leptospira idonii TaxID=1193500 RepID=A0A4R9M0T9_9LEPT|nr:DUF262 domain-containing protein [Leptospira idonii]TGN18849.1 DUF262 domain-containing protein [Leptospira idonii]